MLPRFASAATCVVLGFAAVVGVAPQRGSASAEQVFAVALPGDRSIELSFATEPALEDCRPSGSRDDTQAWECARQRLDVTTAREGGADVVRFTLAATRPGAFELLGYGARATVPWEGGEALWSYNRLAEDGIMETSLEDPVRFESNANRGIPFAELVDRRGRNRLALGLLAQNRRVTVEGRREGHDYAFSMRRIDGAFSESFADGFFVSRDTDTWFHVGRAYTAVVDREHAYYPLPAPAGAYDATYDSWYWTEDHIDEELVWKLASRSRELGFRNVLVDAGWDAPSGQYSLAIDGATGDYTPPAEAFGDFPGLISRIRGELGMRVMLWMQQYVLGRRSAYYSDVGGSLTHVFDASTGKVRETSALCPRTTDGREHVAAIVGRVVDDFQPDALWFDWQDALPGECVAPHGHDVEEFGVAYNDAQRGVYDAVQLRNPDVYMEMRWPFANLNNKRYVHLWQPVDSPGDFELMRLRALQMRPFAAGVAMGTDEMYWSPRVSDVEAARYMAAVVFTGIPYFGCNILAEPEHRREILRSWLAFYEENKDDLVSGSFEPYGNRERPDQFIESPRAAFIYYGNRYRDVVELEKGSSTIHVVNASYSPGIDLRVSGIAPGTYVATLSDLRLRKRSTEGSVRLDGSATLRYNVQMGCMLTLRR